MVTNIAAGDYTSLKGVDFGTGAKTFEVRAASASSGGTVEVHLESATGTVVATCSVTGTGGATTWKTFSCDVTDCSGVKNVYFVYKGTGEPFRLNWFRFTSKDVGINKSVNQIQQAQETRNLFAYPLIGTNKLPDGSIYDLSGKMVRSPLKNSSLLNKPAMGIFIVKKK
jgi:hypothetical protein